MSDFTRDHFDFTLTDAMEDAATDRIAWAMLVASGEQSPRKSWSENADEWREKAEGVFRAALIAAVEQPNRPKDE